MKRSHLSNISRGNTLFSHRLVFNTLLMSYALSTRSLILTCSQIHWAPRFWHLLLHVCANRIYLLSFWQVASMRILSSTIGHFSPPIYTTFFRHRSILQVRRDLYFDLQRWVTLIDTLAFWYASKAFASMYLAEGHRRLYISNLTYSAFAQHIHAPLLPHIEQVPLMAPLKCHPYN